MPRKTRFKTKYPGVYYIESAAVATGKPERVFYITYRKNGRLIEEKAGRQFQDDMSPARASVLRAQRIEGNEPSNKERREARKAEQLAIANRWTIARLWDLYKDQRTLKGLAQDTSRFRRYITPSFADKEPGEIITLDIDRLRLRMERSMGKSPQTVKHALALLRRIIRFGVKKGVCPAPDPARLNFEMPRVDNERTEDLTPEELGRLWDAMEADQNIQVAGVMKAALLTGMRRGELFKLRWDDIDFQRGFIRIRDPKGGPDQLIPLSGPARMHFMTHPRTASPYVFPGRGGRQRTCINKQLERIKKRADLPADFRPLHGLRHVYASMLASSGKVDMYTLQKLLTHKSAAMTQRYAHLRDDALRRAADVAEELFGNIGNGSRVVPDESQVPEARQGNKVVRMGGGGA